MKYSPLCFNVISDIHHYSLKNGFGGKAYDFANSKSQKLLAESGEVLQTCLDQIAEDKRSDIVLVSGDVTNNGELSSHAEVISMLRDLKSKGKRVYVITATHDYSKDGQTVGYIGDSTFKVPAATRDILFDMYREFGPDDALSIHRDSMSYVVQLCEGYRLFALNDDSNHNGKSGFSDDCFKWICENAEKAHKDGQFIIAMTHHPLIAPSPVYELIGKGDMLGDYEKRLSELADIGIQLILTGHTHIHDVSSFQSERGNMIYDVCCGTPIGYPGVMRNITVDPAESVIRVTTDKVKTPASFSSRGLDIDDMLEEQLIGVIRNMIKTAGEDIDKLANMTTAISIKPKVIYKFGWIIKPVFRFLNNLKIGTVGSWTSKETGLNKNDYADIKDRKVVDLITELALNLYGGESKYPPETSIYKITMGFIGIIDSILKTLRIDIKKILKVVPRDRKSVV